MASEKKHKVGYLIPFILVLALVPLVSMIHKYDCGLQVNDWFSLDGETYDFFLYYKSKVFLILGLVLCFYIAYQTVTGRRKFPAGKSGVIVLGGAGVFLLFSLFSVFASENPSFAFWGGYEQWEGFVILFSYVMVFLFGYLCVDQEESFHFIFGSLTVGALLVGALGALQAFGYDYAGTDIAHRILTSFESSALADAQIALSFDKGMSFSTLYNPNYVGTYAALVIPVLAGVVIWEKRIWLKAAAGIAAAALLISVVASGSFAGVIGIGVAVLFLLVFLLPEWKRHKVAGGIAVAYLAAAALIVAVVKPGPVAGVIQRLTESAQVNDVHMVEHMDLRDNTLLVTSRSGKEIAMTVNFDGSYFRCAFPEEDRAPVSFQEMNDASATVAVNLTETESVNVFTQLGEETGWVPVFKMQGTGNDFTFVWEDGKLRYYSVFGRTAKLRKAETFGFADNMRFATGRGYIWSRTFPLLPGHILVGCGADNFVYDFPNSDYVGKQNYGFETQTITKPHNMYLQIWVQDGLLALLGFLAVVLLYTIDVFRLCFLKKEKGFVAGMALCTFLGIAGYMAVGLANDSTITVAPVFWGLLGLGFALNRKLQLKSRG